MYLLWCTSGVPVVVYFRCTCCGVLQVYLLWCTSGVPVEVYFRYVQNCLISTIAIHYALVYFWCTLFWCSSSTFQKLKLAPTFIYLFYGNTMCVPTCQVEFVLRELSFYTLLPRSKFIGLFRRLLGSEKNCPAF